ncbi:MAG: marine proteobacterial sortase target protein [Caulobacter sp.]|nr:marine proteobacterial sortase target protein [Caulobacter sp.]
MTRFWCGLKAAGRGALIATLAGLLCVGPASLVQAQSRAQTQSQARAPGPAATVAEPPPAVAGALRLVKGEVVTEAVRLGVDVQVEIAGPVVRTTVTQAFRNTTRDWVEATYSYPLPEDAAVDSLKMVVGDRVIIGEIKEKEEARILYEQAKSSGARAGLVEQDRPNMFTNKVANVGPGETVLVQIQYQGVARQTGNQWSIRVPFTLTPRYTPPDIAEGLIRPVAFKPAGPSNTPIGLSVRLKAGFPLASAGSRSYRMKVVDEGDQGRLFTLDDPKAIGDHDFELTWTATPDRAPQAGLFTETVKGSRYVLALVTPPAGPPPKTPPPREVVFVVDNSGSMRGQSMEQAKESVVYGLTQLKPGDSFNVIRFDDTLETLFPAAVSADRRNVGKAVLFVRGLEASGGTEMLPALLQALSGPAPRDGRVRQVVFLTDGAVSDEQRMMAAIGDDQGRSRIFMVGIGSAPNSYLMTQMAAVGRGSFTYIASTSEVTSRMRGLFDKLGSPVATNLTARFEGVQADVTPAQLPDLYRGEPVMVAAKVKGRGGRVVLSGRVDGKPWTRTLALSTAIKGPGVSKVWARRRIGEVQTDRVLGKIEGDAADKLVVALAMRHSLVTDLTSLVAVDKTPVRPAGEGLREEDIPLPLPAGWKFEELFAKPAAAMAKPGEASETEQSVDLPQTATNYPLTLLAGLMLLLLGLALGWRGRGRGRGRA